MGLKRRAYGRAVKHEYFAVRMLYLASISEDTFNLNHIVCCKTFVSFRQLDTFLHCKEQNIKTTRGYLVKLSDFSVMLFNYQIQNIPQKNSEYLTTIEN